VFFSERSEATEVGDVPAVAPDIQQLPYVEVPLFPASLRNAACNGSMPENRQVTQPLKVTVVELKVDFMSDSLNICADTLAVLIEYQHVRSIILVLFQVVSICRLLSELLL